MANGRTGRGQREGGGRARARRWREDERQLHHGLDLVDYLDELTEARVEGRENLPTAGERALKVLDRFLANLARALGMDAERPGMADSIRHLERIPGVPRDIARQAERFRDTRNALAHNPDIMLRPEAAMRVIDGAEGIIRMAAERAPDLSRRRVVTARENEPLADARDRLLTHRYDQLVVIDARGGVVDLLTDRDIVVAEARDDNGDAPLSVGDAIATRGHPAIALLPASSSAAEAIDALRDERVAAVVLTERGRLGEQPLGIITRGDVLKAL